MSKANSRKRANGKTKKDVVEIPKQLPPLMQPEADYFNELVTASNQYSDLLKQKAQYQFIVGQLTENRKKVQKDEIKLPVGIVLIPKVMTYQEDDKKKVLQMFDKHIKIFNTNLTTIESQLEFAYENFTESGIRNKELLMRRFEKTIVKNIASERTIVKGEETLFEAELNDMVKVEDGKVIKDEKKISELKDAVKEAVKRNEKSKTACECKSCKDKK